MVLEAAVHILAAVAATWRLTDMILGDRIFEPIRKRFPGYLLTCPRCVSVWAGIACTAAYLLWPWANWPLALSWSYLFLLHVQSNPGRGRR